MNSFARLIRVLSVFVGTGGAFFDTCGSVTDDQSGVKLLLDTVDLSGRTVKAFTWHPSERSSAIKGKEIMV